MQYFKPDDFSPNLFHPYYFIRNGLYNKIRENASFLKGRLLDFGCGSKPYKKYFTVDEYVGIDFENEGHPHDFEQIDIIYDGKHIPAPDNSFDSVLTTEVFEHIFNLPHVLQELNRVLKPGGYMLVTCPFVWNEHEVPYDYARYTRFALEDMARQAGFTVEKTDKSGNFITAVTQLRVLYFFQTFYWRLSKFFFTRWLFVFFFIFIPNVFGKIASSLLPKNTTLYLNNIVVLRKAI
ncbi:MAG: class I SAM-dependent methyltransferase [Ferruginibacter sp.]